MFFGFAEVTTLNIKGLAKINLTLAKPSLNFDIQIRIS
jgi:hypothetical protein